MKTIPLLLLALFCLTSCEPDDPNLIPHDTFVRSYADLMEVSVLTQQAGLDSALATRAIDSVLAHENITREQLMASVRWYSRDVHNWNGILEEVSAELERRRISR